MITILSSLALGAFFGLTAGISPGPLLTLVVTETLRHNRKEGIKVALAPLITDLPIIAASLFLLSRFSNYRIALGGISVLGAFFIAWLGWDTVRSKGLKGDMRSVKPESLKKGVITNLLNPHPYLFWLTVGAPSVLKASQSGVAAAFGYVAGFYSLFIASKVAVALVADQSRAFLGGRVYVWILRALGMGLFIFAGLYLFEGLKMILTVPTGIRPAG